MTRLSLGLGTLTAIALFSTPVFAQGATTQQTVSFEVQAINEIKLSGSPSLTISTATAGNAPDAVTASASYAITSNEVNRKITVSLDEAMPSDVTLKINMDAPTNATSAGDVSLTTSAQNAVTGISTLNASGLGITYKLEATSAAGVVSSTSRTVTFTIAAGA
jgi:hypothetical protein